MTGDPKAVEIERRLVEHGVKAGLSERQIARAIRCSRSKVWSIKQALRAAGTIS